jgi:hypothetical protein
VRVGRSLWVARVKEVVEQLGKIDRSEVAAVSVKVAIAVTREKGKGALLGGGCASLPTT